VKQITGYRVMETTDKMLQDQKTGKWRWVTIYMNIRDMSVKEFNEAFPGIRFNLPEVEGEPMTNFSSPVRGQGWWRAAIRAWSVWEEVKPAIDPMRRELEALGF
jgi:hypothetical protein